MHAQIIINPASGRDRPILNILNSVFGKEVDWDVNITHNSGDARRLAQQAVVNGADVVAVYGGDGTVMEVASALAGGKTPLAILPGGTGNGASRMLGIPSDLQQAAALIRPNFTSRAVDLGRLNDHTFILRAHIGFFAQVGTGTLRITKDRYGKLAYMLSGLQHLSSLRPTHYHLTLDSEVVEVDAILAVVVNMSAVAFGNQPIVENVSPFDGLLDVMLLTRTDIIALAEAASSAFLGGRTPLLHWQVRSAEIRSDPPQPISVDGEMIEQTHAKISVWPQAVNVILPPPLPIAHSD